MYTSEEIIEKVRALLALTQSSNPNEAALAASKAQELMQRYHLESALHGYMMPAQYTVQKVELPNNHLWRKRLASTLAQLNFCECFTVANAKEVTFVGDKVSVAIVVELFTYLCQQAAMLANAGYIAHCQMRCSHCKKPDNRVRWQTEFYLGLFEMVKRRLVEQYERFKKADDAQQPEAEQQEIRALLVVKQSQLSEATKAYLGNRKAQTRSFHTDEKKATDAFYVGMSAGMHVTINRMIEREEEPDYACHHRRIAGNIRVRQQKVGLGARGCDGGQSSRLYR